MRLSIPLSLLYPSIAPPSLRCFISEYSLILLFPWSYRSICWCACVFKASLTGSAPNWAWEVFVLVRDWRVWKRKRVRNGERWIRQRERWVGGREREERRAKAEVWDETEQIRVTVSNKGYDTFSTFTFSSSFPFLFVALFLPSFSPTLHLFLHLSPAFVFPRRPKNRSKKKKKKRMRAYITQANYLFHMSAQINKQRSLVCTNPATSVQVIYGFSRTSHLLWPLTCCICLSKRYLYCGILIGPKHAKLWACFNSGLLQPRIAALNHIVAVKLWKSFLFEPNFSFHHHFRAFMPDINLYSVL